LAFEGFGDICIKLNERKTALKAYHLALSTSRKKQEFSQIYFRISLATKMAKIYLKSKMWHKAEGVLHKVITESDVLRIEGFHNIINYRLLAFLYEKLNSMELAKTYINLANAVEKRGKKQRKEEEIILSLPKTSLYNVNSRELFLAKNE